MRKLLNLHCGNIKNYLCILGLQEYENHNQSTLYNNYVPLHIIENLSKVFISGGSISVKGISYPNLQNPDTRWLGSSTNRAYYKFIKGFFGYYQYKTVQFTHINPEKEKILFISSLGTIWEKNDILSPAIPLLQLVLNKDFVEDYFIYQDKDFNKFEDTILDSDPAETLTLIVNNKVFLPAYKNFLRRVDKEIIQVLKDKGVNILYTNKKIDSFIVSENIHRYIKGMSFYQVKNFIGKELLYCSEEDE